MGCRLSKLYSVTESQVMMDLLSFLVLLTSTGGIYGYDYVMPYDGNSGIIAVAGESGGTLTVQEYIPSFKSYTQQSQTRSVIVQLMDPQMSIYRKAFNRYHSPLPISALGTSYIFTSCQATFQRASTELIIATHNRKTDVEITFRLQGNIMYNKTTYSDGDSVTVSMDAFMTIHIKSKFDLTGTLVNSKHSTVAVLSKTLHGGITDLNQLLPIKHYGQEYVVAVNDNQYQMQIISEHNDTLLMLNNGSTLSLGNSRLYRQTLRRNESFSFTTSSPVMTTLCSGSKLIVVPPVSFYSNEIVLPQSNSFYVKVLTKNSTTIRTHFNAQHIVWEDVPFSRFKVGTFRYTSGPTQITSANGSFTTLIYFDSHSTVNFLIQNTGTDYLIPYVLYTYIHATAGEQGGRLKFHTRIQNYENYHYSLNTGLNNLGQSILMRDVSLGISIYGTTNYNRPVSLLQVSAWGTSYIVSSCQPPRAYNSVLVMATHSQKTDVYITFRLQGNVTINSKTYRDGDNLTVTIGEYNTFTVKSRYDLSGTAVRTNSTTIAVFSGWSPYRFNGNIALAQLLPIKHHGQQYVAAVDDNPTMYKMQIISVHSDTKIMLNNGSSVSVNESGIYRQLLGHNESLYFYATRPVMTTLCRDSDNGFVVVPPVSSYIRHTSMHSGTGGILLKILIEDRGDDDKDIVRISPGPVHTIQWSKVLDSQYMVGTLIVQGPHISLSSVHKFSIFAFKPFLVSGEYNFSSEYHPTKDTPGDHIVIYTVAAGTGVSVAISMACGGFVIVRWTKQHRRGGGREREREKEDERKKKQVDPKESPPHPPPGGDPPLVRS